MRTSLITHVILFLTILTLAGCGGVRMEPQEQQRQMGKIFGTWQAPEYPGFVLLIRPDVISILNVDESRKMTCKNAWCEPFYVAPEASMYANTAEVFGKPRITKLNCGVERYVGLGREKTNDGIWVDTMVKNGMWIDNELLLAISTSIHALPALAKHPLAKSRNQSDGVFLTQIRLTRIDEFEPEAVASTKQWLVLQRKASPTSPRWEYAPKL